MSAAVLATLLRVRELFADPERLLLDTSHAARAVDASGQPCDLRSPNARKWDLLGATELFSNDDEIVGGLCRRFADAIGHDYPPGVVDEWLEKPGRAHADVLELLDRVLAPIVEVERLREALATAEERGRLAVQLAEQRLVDAERQRHVYARAIGSLRAELAQAAQARRPCRLAARASSLALDALHLAGAWLLTVGTGRAHQAADRCRINPGCLHEREHVGPCLYPSSDADERLDARRPL